MANMKIEEIEGIGPAMGAKLREVSIVDTDSLLETSCTEKGRQNIAEQTGVSQKLVLKWTQMADLFRIRGVGSEYAELLLASGVDTVVDLGTQNAEDLAAKMAAVNEDKKLTRLVPSATVVGAWTLNARELAPRLEH